jgi:hypothetical protein
MSTMAEDFCRLFAGRLDAVGTEEGGACRATPHELDTTAQWWAKMICNHLDNKRAAVGVYPMVVHLPTYEEWDGESKGAEWGVHWGCVDIDEGEDESLIHARNVRAMLRRFNIAGWIERSRSKGFHVWVFALDWVPARTMREALIAACQMVECPAREVNPKQTKLGWDLTREDWQLGNYVRLPYPGAGAPDFIEQLNYDDRRVVLCPERHVAYGPNSFVIQALAERADIETLAKLADMYTPPEPLVINRRPVDASRSAESRLNGLAHSKWKHGPLREVEDRSAWLWGFARELAKSQLTESEAYEFLCDVHDWYMPKWKGSSRAVELSRMLQKARGG